MKVLITILMACYAVLGTAQNIDERCELPDTLCERQLNFEASDKELNRIYKRIMASIKSGELADRMYVDANELRQSLLSSQRAWITFKDQNCAALYTLHSGVSGRHEAEMDCLIDMTQARSQYLQENYL